MEFEVFRVERRDAVAVVWMNRPEKKNAMSRTFFRELPLVLAELGADPDVRALVLTGAGDAFSAGGDIASFHELRDLPAYRRHLRLVFDAFHAIERAELPVDGGRERHRLRRGHRGHPALRHRHRLRARDVRIPRSDGGAPPGSASCGAPT